MSTTTPAGWYPDPKPNDPAHPGERWWNGTDWTVSTKTDEVPAADPVAQPKLRRRRPALVAGAVAAVLGLGVGSLTTYLIMDGRQSSTSASSPSTQYGNGGGGGNGGGQFGGGTGGGGNGGGTGGGSSTGGNSGNGGSTGGGSGANVAVDVADGVTLPDPGTGWTGGTTSDGHAELAFGPYTCNGTTDGCSLGGVSTSTLAVPSSGGVQAAAVASMPTAVKNAYGTITGHTVLESQAVTVAGRAGYLIRWQVDAKTGNNGTVEDVVFPTSTGKSLVSVQMGFDIAKGAPSVSLMNTIVAGIQDYSGSTSTGGGTGTTS